MTIRFTCPSCKTPYTVKDADAGKKADCKVCGQRIQVPQPLRRKTVLGELSDESAPSPAINSIPEPPTPATAPASPPPAYVSYMPADSRPSVPFNRILAGAAAGLLFLGLFMPMIHAPLGIWLSFIDVPVKAVGVGFAIGDVFADALEKKLEEKNTEPKDRRRPEPDRTDTQLEPPSKESRKAAAGAGWLILVGIVGTLYPILIIALSALSAYRVTTRGNMTLCKVAGIVALASTVLYAILLLLLNSNSLLRPLMALLSPGFGWAVMLIGSCTLIASGVIRSPRSLVIAPSASLPIAAFASEPTADVLSASEPAAYTRAVPRRSRSKSNTGLIAIGIVAAFFLSVSCLVGMIAMMANRDQSTQVEKKSEKGASPPAKSRGGR